MNDMENIAEIVLRATLPSAAGAFTAAKVAADWK